jgi:hypothetical protein
VKLKYTLILLFFLTLKNIHSQESPIKWINSEFNINRIKDNDGSGHQDLRFKFVNTGNHITFIDTTKNEYKLVSSSLTKPGDTSELNIINYKWKTGKQRDTVIYFTLPFYYEGKTIREKLSIKFSYGKSKLIDYDDFDVDLTEEVAKIIEKDTIQEYPSLIYKHFVSIKNIYDKPIYLTDNFVTYNDTYNLQGHKIIKLLPKEKHKIQINLYMDRKYRFKKAVNIEVYSEDISEIFYFQIKSNYKSKKNNTN